MKLIRPVRYDATLPATPCTQALRARIIEVSKSEGVSVAEVQRAAFEFFLSHYDKLVIGEAKKLGTEVQ